MSVLVSWLKLLLLLSWVKMFCSEDVRRLTLSWLVMAFILVPLVSWVMRVGKMGLGLCDLVSFLMSCQALCGFRSVSMRLQVSLHDSDL